MSRTVALVGSPAQGSKASMNTLQARGCQMVVLGCCWPNSQEAAPAEAGRIAIHGNVTF